MAGYHIQEGLIELPEGWDDKTINIFARDLPPNQVASIVITRDDITTSLREFVDKTVKQLTKQLPRFALAKRSVASFGVIEGEELSFQWRRENVDIFQMQAFVPVTDERVLTFTVSAPLKFRGEVEQELVSIVGDLKLRRTE